MPKPRKSWSAEPTTGGELCPKCSKPMQRYKHLSDWRPREGQPFHYAYWDRCFPCQHIQHYEAAKIYDIEPELELEVAPAPYQGPTKLSTSYYRAAGAAMYDGENWLALDAEGQTIGVCLTRTEAWRIADSCGMIEVLRP